MFSETSSSGPVVGVLDDGVSRRFLTRVSGTPTEVCSKGPYCVYLTSSVPPKDFLRPDPFPYPTLLFWTHPFPILHSGLVPGSPRVLVPDLHSGTPPGPHRPHHSATNYSIERPKDFSPVKTERSHDYLTLPLNLDPPVTPWSYSPTVSPLRSCVGGTGPLP